MEQRYIPLSFTPGSGTLTATAPRNANVAPPGMYMLFAIDANGVPSTSRMVSLKEDVAPTVGLTQPAGGATFRAPATVSIAATATDTDGTVAKVEFFNGATQLGEDTTAPYTYNWTGVAGGSYTLTARATDNLGATTTSAARTITVFVTPPSGSPSPITDFGAEPQPTASHALVPSVAPPIAVPAPKARRYSGRVVRVVNGDTVRVRLSSGRVRSVRLLGIDSPNRKQPGAPAECGSRQAASALRGLLVQGRRGRLGGRRVRLTTDPTQDRYDHYGRLLAYASRGSLDINREMVRRGWAMVYVYNGKPARRTYSYSAAQSSAKAARRGAWRICGGDFHRG
ncbi:MAG: Ig-like domain-containing protein [Chloroflexota bacterium]|nr:Ig-like domain-containing protein [Chloroflexota bacterium]